MTVTSGARAPCAFAGATLASITYVEHREAIGTRRAADVLAEYPGEMRLRLVAHARGDLHQRQPAGGEQLLRALHAQQRDIEVRRVAPRHLVHACEVGRTRMPPGPQMAPPSHPREVLFAVSQGRNVALWGGARAP